MRVEMGLDVRQVVAEVEQERRRQDVKHGGPSHDDTHTPFEWQDMIDGHLQRAHGHCVDGARELWRREMIRVAALAVAAAEALDRGAMR